MGVYVPVTVVVPAPAEWQALGLVAADDGQGASVSETPPA